MKNNKLIDAIGNINDKYVKEAHEKKKFVFDFALVGKLATAALAIFLVVGVIPNLFGMGGATKSEQSSPTEEFSYDTNRVGGVGGVGGFGDSVADAKSESILINENKKVIVTGNLNIETLDFDTVLVKLENNVSKYGGYIQSSSISTNRYDARYYYATIRIPADAYDEFLANTKENVNVTYYNESIDDITQSYTDLEARVTSLKAEEEKVLEFYDKASNLDELMSIESRLTDIRYEIDLIETSLKNYDLLVSYSTLNINIEETKVYTKTNDNFFSRISLNFVNGWNNFVNVLEDIILSIVYNIWLIIVLAAIVVGIIIYRKRKNRK